ncbi:serine hydrolase, partial [Klebsiella pneumoniae]|uniref:serine hydrolase n=1 Tax=Klebsiella pneumoniae TaxID=573 RepID=UPI0013D1BCFE
SISKLFVNVAVLREVERGGLALEAPIGRYVPNLPPRLAKATIAELMLHTAGLRRESPLRVDEALTVAEHVARL